MTDRRGGGITFDTSEFTSLAATLSVAIQEDVARRVKIGVQKVAERLEQAISDNISIQHYTLAQLKEMGHPYARKSFGRAAIGGGGTDPGTTSAPASSRGSIGSTGLDPFVVNYQGAVLGGAPSGPGSLRGALSWDWSDMGDKAMAAIVGIDEGEAQHVRHIVYGTKFMIARDFLEATLLATIDELFEIFERETGLEQW